MLRLHPQVPRLLSALSKGNRLVLLAEESAVGSIN